MDVQILKNHISIDSVEQRRTYKDLIETTTCITVKNLLIDENIAKLLSLCFSFRHTDSTDILLHAVEIEDSFARLEKVDYPSTLSPKPVTLIFENCEFDSPTDTYPTILFTILEYTNKIIFKKCTIHKLRMQAFPTNLWKDGLTLFFSDTEGSLCLKDIISSDDKLFAINSDVSIILDNTPYLTDVLSWALCQQKNGIQVIRDRNSFICSNSMKKASAALSKAISKQRNLAQTYYFYNRDSAALKKMVNDTNVEIQLAQEKVKSSTFPTAILATKDISQLHKLKELEGTVQNGILITGVYYIKYNYLIKSQFSSGFHKQSAFLNIANTRLQILTSAGLFVLTRKGDTKDINDVLNYDIYRNGTFFRQDSKFLKSDAKNLNTLTGQDLAPYIPFSINLDSISLIPVGEPLDNTTVTEHSLYKIYKKSDVQKLKDINKLTDSFESILYSADKYSREVFSLHT